MEEKEIIDIIREYLEKEIGDLTCVIIPRNDTSSNWALNDPTLADGEYGVETDTHRVKRGDGKSEWTELPYETFGIENLVETEAGQIVYDNSVSGAEETDVQSIIDRIWDMLGDAIKDLDTKEAEIHKAKVIEEESDVLYPSVKAVMDYVKAVVGVVQENLDGAKSELEAEIENVQTNLDVTKAGLEASIEDAKAELKKAIDDNTGADKEALARLEASDVELRASIDENKAAIADTNTALETEVHDLENAIKSTNEAVEINRQNIIDMKELVDSNKAELDKELENTKLALELEIDTNKSQIETALANTVADLTTKIDGVETDLTTEIDSVRADLETAKTEVGATLDAAKTEIDASIDNARTDLEAKIEENAKADNEAKAELDTKIDAAKSELEKDITDLGVLVETNTSNIANNKATIEANKADIEAKLEEAETELNTKIDTTKSDLEASIEKVKEDLTSGSEASIADLELKINESNAEVEANKTAITENKEAIEENKEAIANTKAELETTIANTKTELETKIDTVESGLTTSINDTKTSLETSIADTKTELNTSIDNAKAELNTGIEEVATDLETAKTEIEEAKLDKAFTDNLVNKVESVSLVGNEILSLEVTNINPADKTTNKEVIKLVSSDGTVIATKNDDGSIDLKSTLDVDVHYFVTSATLSTTIPSENVVGLDTLTPTTKDAVEVQDIITDAEGTWARVQSIDKEANTLVAVTFHQHAQAVWGTVKGNITDQADLQTQFATKLDKTEFETYKSENTSELEGVETTIAEHKTAIDKNAEDITANAQAILDNKTAIESNDADIETLNTKVAENTEDISNNAAAIAQNITDIATNKTDIADNKTAIEENKTAIETNTSAIAENKSAIEANSALLEANKTAIAENKEAIEFNKTTLEEHAIAISNNIDAIEKNAEDIAINKVSIETNTQAIADNKTAIEKNASDIAVNKLVTETNKADIEALKVNTTTNREATEKNAEDIATNKEAIKANKEAIEANKADIEILNTGVAENKASIEANEVAIAENKTFIETVKTSVDTNTADIATNKEAIEGINTTIETLETSINANAEAIANNETAIEEINANIDTVEADITTNAEAIVKNAADIAGIDTRVTKNEGDITTIKGKAVMYEDNDDVSLRKDIIVKTNQKVLGTSPSGSTHVLAATLAWNVGTENEFVQNEFGSMTVHANLNSVDRPTIEMPTGKEEVAYKSELENLTSVSNELIEANKVAIAENKSAIESNGTDIKNLQDNKADKTFATATDNKVVGNVTLGEISNSTIAKLNVTNVSPVGGATTTKTFDLKSTDNTLVAKAITDSNGNITGYDLATNLDVDVNYFVTSVKLSTEIPSENVIGIYTLTAVTTTGEVELHDIITDADGTWARVQSVDTVNDTITCVTFNKHAQAVWGTIKGNITEQQDLQEALDNKFGLEDFYFVSKVELDNGSSVGITPKITSTQKHYNYNTDTLADYKQSVSFGSLDGSIVYDYRLTSDSSSEENGTSGTIFIGVEPEKIAFDAKDSGLSSKLVNQAIREVKALVDTKVATEDFEEFKTANEADIQKVKDDVTIAKSDIANLKIKTEEIDTNTQAIADNKAAIEENKTAIETIDTKVTEQGTAIEALEALVPTIEGDTEALVEVSKTVVENTNAIEENKAAIEENKASIEENAVEIAGLQNVVDTKVDKVTEQNRVYGTDEEGNQTTYSVEDFGAVKTVNGVEPDENKNIEVTAADITYDTTQVTPEFVGVADKMQDQINMLIEQIEYLTTLAYYTQRVWSLDRLYAEEDYSNYAYDISDGDFFSATSSNNVVLMGKIIDSAKSQSVSPADYTNAYNYLKAMVEAGGVALVGIPEQVEEVNPKAIVRFEGEEIIQGYLSETSIPARFIMKLTNQETSEEEERIVDLVAGQLEYEVPMTIEQFPTYFELQRLLTTTGNYGNFGDWQYDEPVVDSEKYTITYTITYTEPQV